tara:strand:- start:92 stop:568 length:477 start_codon:yes stop_codon:yes gene_type:complete
MASRETIVQVLTEFSASTGRTIPNELPSVWLRDYKDVPDDAFVAGMTALLHSTSERQFPMKGQFLEALQTTRFRYYRLGSSAQSNTDATTHQRPELIDPETTKQKRQAFFSRLREQAKTKSASSGVRHHDDPRYQALLDLGEQLARRNATPQDATSLG